jgi:subtilisin
MTRQGPAWSWQFRPEAVQPLRPIDPIEQITRDWAWGGSLGEGVKVAVIDSGVDASHPAVGAVAGYMAISERANELVYDPTPHEDAYGHGNACAGIIRALAPACEIYSVKVLGAGLSGRGSVFVAGLRWAIENGMHVCNLSLGTTKKEFFGILHELADLAYFQNVMLVTAANNMPIPSFPSVYAAVISVASHEGKDPYAFYYNPNPPVEFGAPGIDVEVAWRQGSWITSTGNSFAAPHITGIVAKILGKHPGLNVFQMKVILRALAMNVSLETDISDRHEARQDPGSQDHEASPRQQAAEADSRQRPPPPPEASG